uniref:Uncharacterized protein n=1 Tax=Oryza rufipogon TaxID=4529 RepID=A0A0E0PY60_ORYRU
MALCPLTDAHRALPPLPPPCSPSAATTVAPLLPIPPPFLSSLSSACICALLDAANGSDGRSNADIGADASSSSSSLGGGMSRGYVVKTAPPATQGTAADTRGGGCVSGHVDEALGADALAD